MKLGLEFGAVIGLHELHADRQATQDLVDEPDGRVLDQEGISDDIHLFNDKLREWENYYNYHGPHGALGGQTPFERLPGKNKS